MSSNPNESFLVGSPDQLDPIVTPRRRPIPIPSTLNASSSFLSHAQRPSLTAHRSISSPTFPRTPRRNLADPGTSASITSAHRHGVTSAAFPPVRWSAKPEHQWSLFGQLMENEGQLPASPSSQSGTSRRSALGPRKRKARSPSVNNRAGALLSASASGDQRSFVSSSLTSFVGHRDESGSDPFFAPDVQSPDAVREGEQYPGFPVEFLHDRLSEHEEYNSNLSSDSDNDHDGGHNSHSHSGSDSESDSEFESEFTSTSTLLPSPPAPTTTAPSLFPRFWYRIPELSPVHRNILKCSIAYFVASLFTFSPYLSGLMAQLTNYGSEGGKVRPSPSGHMVATIAVYFNPAKTLGAMAEADLFCLYGLLYSSFICLFAMGIFWVIDQSRLTGGAGASEWEWLGDSVAVLWVGLAMCGVAWGKVWMGNASFNTACSMTAIIIFVVLVKEGGLQTLAQTSTIVLLGSLISNVTCYFIWPSTATHHLQTSMSGTLGSFGVLLSMLTGVFLVEEGDGSKGTSYERLQRAVEAHQASFTSLKKNLAEARKEWIGASYRDGFAGADGAAGSGVNDASGTGKGNGAGARAAEGGYARAYEDAVDSLNRLGQHLNGLRSGTRLQGELMRRGVEVGTWAGRGGPRKRKAGKGKGKQAHMRGDDARDSGEEGSEVEDEETRELRSAAAMFGDLVDELGPPLKALSTACARSLRRLRESFVLSQSSDDDYFSSEIGSKSKSSPQGKPPSNMRSPKKPKSKSNLPKKRRRIEPHEFSELVDGIEKALLRFESTSNHAVIRVYRKRERESRGLILTEEESDEGEGEEENTMLTKGGDGEHVFLVYFFIFTLQEFARELVSLVDAMGRVYAFEQRRARRRGWGMRVLRAASDAGRWVWRWVGQCWHRRRAGGGLGEERRRGMGLRRSLSAYILPPSPRRTHPSFPKIRPHAPNTIQTPDPRYLSLYGRIKQTLWTVGTRMGERDVRYALKVGMATSILAAPAFWDRTRELFVRYWGDWALISFFVVMSPTIGATNYLSLQRVLGTLFGAAVAAGIYSLFPENAIVLSSFGFLFSIPCFYYAVAKPQYLSASRFVLLTYNLTCLYCYNLRQKDVSVLDVAFHRALAVTAGVVWAAFISRFWWPAEARRELGKALGEFCLNLGWLYTRLVASNSFAPEYRNESGEESDSPSQPVTRLTRLNNSIQEFMAMELHLQIKLIELQGLLAQTQHEPRLKGPFPVQLYRGVLTSLQTILDKLHSMRCVTTREEWYTTVRHDFIIPVNKERHEMVGNIILSFSTLASAFRLKAPLPPYLPPVEKARERLVEAIRNLDVVRNRDIKGSRQLLFFAYAMTMKGVTEELESLGRTLQGAFGVIGQTPEEFEALFVDPEQGGRVMEFHS